MLSWLEAVGTFYNQSFAVEAFLPAAASQHHVPTSVCRAFTAHTAQVLEIDFAPKSPSPGIWQCCEIFQEPKLEQHRVTADQGLYPILLLQV